MSPVAVSTSYSHRQQKTKKACLWLILVGINQYQDEHFPSLSYAASDCQALAEAFTAETDEIFPEKQVRIYHDFAEQKPNLVTVIKSLEEIVKRAKIEDTLLFYFSGHGMLDRQTKQAILCLGDTRENDLLTTGLKLSKLLTLLGKCAAHQQLVWLDACHSGSMTLRLNPTAQIVETLQEKAQKSQGFYALLSCDRGQQAWEFPELEHGVFTYYLTRGLSGEAADRQGIIDADGLYRYVYHQTLQYIDKTNQQLRLINQQQRSRGIMELRSEYSLQTPKRIVEGIGEVILGKRSPDFQLVNNRQAIVVEGIPSSGTTLALSKILRRAGNFELEYLPRSQKTCAEAKDAIARCFQSPQIQTILLYLRARIETTTEGESWLVFAEEYRISRSWLRQVLRHSQIAQQILILDCPGTKNIADWLEDLQLPTERGQCLITATAEEENTEEFVQGLLTTLEKANQISGLPVAEWITNLQLELAASQINLHVWLSGAQGILEILPEKIGLQPQDSSEGLDLGVSPYLGLRAFRETDSRYFYGRENLTQTLVNQLWQQPFLAVVGASGSGKSSVLQAGLIAQIKQGKQIPGSKQWWLKSFRPGAKPWQALMQTLVNSEDEKLELEGLFHLGVEGFVQWLRSRPEPVVVLVIDQFEEFFTLASPNEQKNCLKILLKAVEYAGDRFKLVIAIRADFISACLEIPELANLLQQSSVLVPPNLTAEDYRHAIIKPAEQVGLKVEPELVELLLQQLDRATGDLPLLQFVLEQLWENRCQGKLTLTAYQQQIGGIKGALERKAEAVYDSLDPAAQACAKWIFLNLTQLGEGTEDTRRRVLKSELAVNKYPADLVARTLQALTASKLVVVNAINHPQNGNSKGERSPQTNEVYLESEREEITVEVAHEVLIRHWSTLRWWLAENRARMQLQRQLEQAAKLWWQNEQHSDFLLQGLRLAEAEDIYIKYVDELSTEVQEFIVACLDEREKQQKQAKKRLRQAQIAATVISILGIAALGLGGLSYWQSQQVRASQVETLNSLAENLSLSERQLEALLAGIKAANQLQRLPSITVTDRLKNTTVQNLNYLLQNIQERNRLVGHQDSITGVDFSPDNQYIATASADNTIKIWSFQGEEIATLQGHQDSVTSVSFSPDGKTIVSGSLDKTVKLWDLQGAEIKTLRGHQDSVTSVAFSPDRKTIVSGSLDQTVKLWNLQGGEIKTLRGHQGWISSVSVSPDGQIIASASSDRTIRLWNLEGEVLQVLQGHNAEVLEVTFHPNQPEIIASAAADKTIKIWHLDGSLQATFVGHENWVNSVQFSPDGQMIASGSGDKMVKLWNLNGKEIDIFAGHQGEITELAFSPDGQTLASASDDRTVKIWQLKTISFKRRLSGHEQPVIQAVFSPDGQTLATASLDNTLKLWHPQGKEIITLTGHDNWVTDVKFSPDNQVIASASQDKTIKLWSRDGKLLQTLSGHEEPVNRISFSPDGKLLASASDDKTIKIWSFDGRELLSLEAHEQPIYSLNFSPDGKLIASGSKDKTVKIWTIDGKIVTVIKGHQDEIWSVKFSPDSKIIASASRDRTIRLWNLDGELLQTLSGHESTVWDISFSPEGKVLASASEDKTIKLWSLASFQELQTLQGHEAGVLSVNFSPDGKLILSSSFDKTAKLWSYDSSAAQSLNLDQLIADSCNWLENYLQYNPQVSNSDRQVCF
ncbi:MAG: caspase family protein [Oscillatoria sp. PMC 1051.18]|nr:caspase family protein [Oscillatoria sp. PMC 1050.18]MEC5033160.1 caspase family protein [Oscillatoria sp. PMC 1051.18]MEC5033176.1 caspase family protein [Oscillatoria sp. PMC 1051.18]